jgi:Holliday junction resolvase RusA-like endonuclease
VADFFSFSFLNSSAFQPKREKKPCHGADIGPVGHRTHSSFIPAAPQKKRGNSNRENSPPESDMPPPLAVGQEIICLLSSDEEQQEKPQGTRQAASSDVASWSTPIHGGKRDNKRPPSKPRGRGRPRKHPKVAHFRYDATALSLHTPRDLHFEVAGRPIPKARVARGKSALYNPSKGMEIEFAKVFKEVFKKDYSKDVSHFSTSQLLKMDLQFLFASETAILKTPDIDNLAKFVLDSLNKLAYHDDRQIIDLSARKALSSDSSGKTIVKIELIEDPGNG